MHFLDTLLRLIFVPRCAGCNERLPIDAPPLCPHCYSLYENEKAVTCGVCAERLGDCFCLPVPMQRHGVRRMVKLFHYRKDGEAVTSRMIYTLKHKNLRDLQAFFAKELTHRLIAAELSRDKTVVTYPPRSRAALARDGFDHAGALAREVARALEVPFLHTLARVESREQKKLSRTERLRAAEKSYSLRDGTDVRGKTVILCDDVCTTGATLLAASRILRRAGAREVILATLALVP